MTTPVSTATPHSVMKPTPAVIDNGMPRSHSAMTPPVSASGTPLNTSAASFADPKVSSSSAKIITSVTGTSSVRRSVADCSCSKVPP